MTETENENCDICKKNVGDQEEGLLCNKCLTWKHRECLNISEKAYQRLAKSKQDWHCNTCKTKAGSKTTEKSGKDYTIGDVMAKLEQMDNRYNILFQKYNEQKQINNELQNELSEIKNQLNKTEQRELNNNIIIQGIPYKNEENIEGIVKKIGEKLQISLTSQNFSATRLGKIANKATPIKVILTSSEVKKQVMKSKVKTRLNTEGLGFTEKNKIFINHDLTKKNMELFKAAQEFRKANDYKFLWISDGNILMKKIENSKAMLVQSINDLKN